MKKGILILSILLTNFVSSQISQQYSNWTSTDYQQSINFLYESISEDYGPRVLTKITGESRYDFHGGIDLTKEIINNTNTDINKDGLVASFEGKIIYISGNGIKDLIVKKDNSDEIISYRHLFYGNGGGFKIHGGFSLVPIPNTSRYAIVNLTSTPYNAYSSNNGETIVYDVDGDGDNDTLTTTDSFVVGELLAPIGDSNGSFAPHLHIQGISELIYNSGVLNESETYLDSNSYNPLYLLNYNGIDLDVEVPENYSLDETSLTVKCEVSNANIVQSSLKRYTNGISDIKEVLLLLQSDLNGIQYNLVNNSGNLFQFDIGGDYFGGNANPSILYQSTNYSFQDEHWNSSRMMNPKMYSSRRYDEYFFNLNNFNSLISSNSTANAKISSQARYPEQDYSLRAKAVTLSNLQGFISPITTTINIDNFLPYIKKVTLSDSEGIFYEAEWILNNSETSLTLERCTYRDEITNGFEIEVETSESLNNLSISILNVSDFPLAFLNTDKTLWGASLSVNIPNNNEHTITFNGTDTAGNLLLTAPSNLYYRVSDTTWDSYTPNSPTTPSLGSDTIHKINLPISTSCTCDLQNRRSIENINQLVELTVSGSTEVCEGELTALTVSGGSGSYNWYLEGDYISDENTLSYILPVGENNITVVDVADPCDTNATFTVIVHNSPTASAGSNVTIQNGGSTTLQGSGGTSCSWSPTTGLSNPNSCTTTASPSETTTYMLTVTENGCTDTDTVTITVDGSTGGNPPANDDCSNAITLNSSTICNYTTGTVEDATPSFGANLCDGCSCTSPDDYDVYYKFNAVATSHTVTVSNYASNFDAVIELRTSCSSGSSNYISCYDPSGAPSSVSETWTGLTIGQTYYIRVFEWGYQQSPPNADTFDICVTHQNSNTNGIDLVSNITGVSDDNPDTGDQISVDYSITNAGDETMFGDTTTALYLSTNQSYGSSDILLQGSVYVLTNNLSSNQSINLESTIVIPNVSDGQYYIISYPDIANLITEDADDNNTDSFPIYIGESIENGPDLDIKGMSVTPNSGLVPGQEVDIEIEIENEGNEDASSFDVLLFLDINGNDDYDTNESMGVFNFGSLDAGEDNTVVVDFDLPVNITSTGVYELFAIADSNNDITETNENNNDKDRNITIALAGDGQEDITVINASVAESTVNAGGTINVLSNHIYLGNQTSSDLPTLRLGYYLSTDCDFSYAEDIFLDDDSSNLGINNPNHEEDEILTIPPLTPSGNYYILFVADSENLIDEGSLESNNIECIQITITSTSTPNGDIYITDEVCNPTDVIIGSEIEPFANINYVGNQTNADIPSIEVFYFLSNDCTLSNDDMLISDDSISLGSDLPINDASDVIQLPNNLSPGTYYIIFRADMENAVYETNENNNIACAEFNLLPANSNYQDVTLNNPFVEVSEANLGDEVYVSVFQNYTGFQTDSEMSSPRLHYYLSLDCDLSSDDYYLEDDPSGIGSDDPSEFEFQTVTIPNDAIAGDYYVLFVADATDIVVENNEDNNLECIPITINDGTLGIEDNEPKEDVIKIYPNPVSDMLTIDLGKIHSKISIDMFNVIGQKISSYEFNNEQLIEINTASLSVGMYFFKITVGGNSSKTFKIIKE